MSVSIIHEYVLDIKPFSNLLVSAQLESLYICISLDYLMTLQDFFISGLPTADAGARSRAASMHADKQAALTTESSESDKNRLKLDQKSSRTSNIVPRTPTTPQPPSPSTADAEVETRIDVIVKNPEVILLEDQHNSNSNCLVLDVRAAIEGERLPPPSVSNSSSSWPCKCA